MCTIEFVAKEWNCAIYGPSIKNFWVFRVLTLSTCGRLRICSIASSKYRLLAKALAITLKLGWMQNQTRELSVRNLVQTDNSRVQFSKCPGYFVCTFNTGCSDYTELTHILLLFCGFEKALGYIRVNIQWICWILIYCNRSMIWEYNVAWNIKISCNYLYCNCCVFDVLVICLHFYWKAGTITNW